MENKQGNLLSSRNTLGCIMKLEAGLPRMVSPIVTVLNLHVCKWVPYEYVFFNNQLEPDLIIPLTEDEVTQQCYVAEPTGIYLSGREPLYRYWAGHSHLAIAFEPYLIQVRSSDAY